ncbi:MAG: hypothetical protein ABSG32_21580 [Terriglobia bacterium]
MRTRLTILCGIALFFGHGLHAQEATPERQNRVFELTSFLSPSLLPTSLPPLASSPESLLLPSSAGRSGTASALTLQDRVNIYLKTYTEPSFYLLPPIGAAYDQRANNPPEWGRGLQGFDRRLASGFGRDIIAHTLKSGFAAADHEDPRHSFSKMHGTWPRARYAFVRTFESPTDGGGKSFAFASVAGNYGAAFISNTWYPKPYATVGHALGRGTSSLAIGILVNELREFSPDVGRCLHRF